MKLESSRRGLLLIEIVASIVLLGTLLCGMIVGMARFREQERRLQLQQVAIQVADQTLKELTDHPELIPSYEQGIAATQDDRLIINAKTWIDTKQSVRFSGQSPQIQPRLLLVEVAEASDDEKALVSTEVLLEWVWWEPEAIVAQGTTP